MPLEKPRIFLKTFLTLVIHLTSVSSFADSTQNANEQVLQFLKDSGIQINQSAQIIKDENLKYHAFAKKDENVILLNPSLNEIQTKINLVHEYIHRYRYQIGANDEIWFSEGLAQMGEFIYSGWPNNYNTIVKDKGYLLLSNDQDDFKPNGYGYPSSFLLFHYLYKHFGGKAFLNQVIHSSKTGWENILESIEILKAKKIIKKDDFVVTKENIIRHFAVALGLNDSYSAKYGLFSTHFRLDKAGVVSDGIFSKINQPRPAGSISIYYSDKYSNQCADCEIYAIKSVDKVEIQKATGPDQGHLYIYIKYSN